MWVGKRRRVFAEAAGLFLAPAAAGAAVLLLEGPAWLTLSYLALGAVLAGTRVGLARRPARPSPPPETEAPAPTQGRRAVGYACVTPEGEELAPHTEAIEAWAAENGVSLTAIVHDEELQTGDFGARPALRGALERIAAGEADTLVTARLVHLSPTAADLALLLRWMTASLRTLVAIDLRLDTATEAGRLAASVLADVGGWERERRPARARRGLQTARAGGGGGGPSVADVPELKQRIARMREQGMTLQAIADALNEEGVPTLRGGAKWRPSSVQRATGYRRPPAVQPSIDLPGPHAARDSEPAPPS